jgi:predicted transcriptional regulator
MKAIDVKQLDEKDQGIADALISLGLGRNAAIILAYLQNMKSAKSFDLERGANLRQPEVSIAVKQLKKHGWINERKDKKPGKGRPYKIYSLKIGFNEIIAQLENERKKAVDESLAKIEQLKELRR